MIDAAAFAQSDALTLGIEEEFFLLDASVGATGIVPRADEILNGAFQTIAVPGGWLKSELLRGTVEVNTAPSASLDQLDVDLRAVRDELARRAVDVGLRAAALGSHPHHKVVRGDVSPTEAHESIADLFDRVGQLPDQSTHGIHVHVGMPDLEAAVGAMDAIAALVPLVIAVTANSPIDRGQVSPWQSVRAERLRVMQWAGPPPRVADAREYDQVRALHQLENTVDQRFLWEVAPVHAL
ncbi:MAG: carboxylate--amine ligase, partial [Thermoleophilia bacterium]|nr:carboxylate--amine ligase [Thermoleophilia bacterium]